MYSVGSFLELLTVASAWHIYERLWGVLVRSGLAYLPLLGLMLSAFRGVMLSGIYRQWPIAVLNTVEWRMYAAFVVILLAAVPSIGVQQNELVYAEQDCALSRSDLRRQQVLHRTEGSSGFDEVRLDGSTIRVPLWWWLLNNIGQGISAVAIGALPCRVDTRKLVVELGDVGLEDPILRQELGRFHKECWQTAYHRALQRVDRVPGKAQLGGRDYVQDISWAGSHYFLNNGGYYDDIYPQSALKRFDYVAERDSAFAPPSRAADGGWPNCATWWSDRGSGLRAHLLAAMPEPLLARWFHRFRRDPQAEERLLYTMLSAQREVGGGVLVDNFARTGLWNRVSDVGQGLLGLYGGTAAAPRMASVFNILRDSAPIVHSVVIMVLIVSLPFVLMAGAYSPDRMIGLSFVFLSIVFWGFLFKLVFWIDTTLEDVLFREDWYQLGVVGSLRWVFNSLMFCLYFSVPLLFTRWASVLGSSAGSVANNVLGIGSGWQSLSRYNPVIPVASNASHNML